MHLNESVWLPKIKSLAISEGSYSLIMVVLTILLFIGVSILTYKRRQFQEINLYLALSEVTKNSKSGCDVLIKTFQSQLRSWKNWEIAQEPIFNNSLNLSSPANVLSTRKSLIHLLQQNVGGKTNYLNGYATYISIWICLKKNVVWSSADWSATSSAHL